MFERLGRTLVPITVLCLFGWGCTGQHSENLDYEPMMVRYTDFDRMHTIIDFLPNDVVTCEEAEFGPEKETSPITGEGSLCSRRVYKEGQITMTEDEQSTFERLLDSHEAWDEYEKIDAEMGLKDTCGHQADQFAVTTGAHDLHFIAADLADTSFARELVDFAFALLARCEPTMQSL